MTEFKETELDERAINMAKVLSADAVEKAGSGHPGSPVSLAPVAYTLYQHFIKHDPNDPNWEGRDRFILSGGHASLTQYVQLYFSGYGVTLDDLKHFRGGADTRTPGHPEYGLTPGIEMTTGPLGQGFASAIGFAYGERFQRGLLDPETPKEESPFYHKIWAICGEGDIEEGISGEAAALAANQKLGNITVIFDANRIQIEGDTNLVLAEDVLKRFQAYGWYTDEFSFIQPDGSYKEDIEGLAEVIAKAEKAAPDQPKLIKVHSLIAWPTPGKTNDPSSHGSKLGAEAVAGLKKLLGYDPEESFHVDEEALAHARKVAERGLEAHKEWDEKFDAWRKANPDKAALYDRLKAGELPEGFDKALDDLRGHLRGRQEGRHPWRLRLRPQRHRGRHAGTVGRLRRPRRLQQDRPQGCRHLRSCGVRHQAVAGLQRVRTSAALRRARVHDGLHHQRHPAGLPHPSVRRHLLHVLRLRALRRPSGRPHGDPEPVRVDARLRRRR